MKKNLIFSHAVNAQSYLRLFLKILSLPLILWVLCTAPCQAEDITLDSTVSVHYNSGNVLVELTLTNKGDETAKDVQPKAVINDFMHEATEKEFTFSSFDLPPGAKKSFRSEQSVDQLGPLPHGIIPVTVFIEYRDINHTLHVVPTYGLLKTTPTPPQMPFEMELADLEITRQAVLPVSVQSLSGNDSLLVIGLLTGPGIGIKKRTRRFLLKKGERKSFEFRLANQSAFPGSKIPLFLFLIREDGESLGCMVVSRNLIVDAEEQSGLGQESPSREYDLLIWMALWIVGLAAAVSIYILYQSCKRP